LGAGPVVEVAIEEVEPRFLQKIRKEVVVIIPTANLKSHSHNDHEQQPYLFWSSIIFFKITRAMAL
jgi:uncharacterized RmlC-like cupin family protein